MSMIEEQIHYLRELAVEYGLDDVEETEKALNEAADTIESLSAKLQAEDVNEGLTLKDRKKFTTFIYSLLEDDETNDRAEQIIGMFDILTGFINVERSVGSHENMTLNEAIEHLNDILQPERKWDCEECRNEHIQLREWLLELQERRGERSAEDCGGWITDRVPTKEECNGREREFAVTVDANGIKTLVMDFVYETVRGREVSRWKWRDRISPWEVIAWHKLPDPYHDP